MLKTHYIFFYTLFPLIFFIYSLFSKNFSAMLNSALTLGIIILFFIFVKKKKIFQEKTCHFIVIFILLSLFLGKALNFYHIIPYWDRILHFLSGFLTAKMGFEIYIKLKGNTINKTLTILFCILFASACASVWEIWEFFSDILFKTNAQNNSLNDTMWDIILGTSSSFLYAFFFCKKRKFF